MAVLPIKLAVLTVKTLAKPLAAAFEARVMQVPAYRAIFIKASVIYIFFPSSSDARDPLYVLVLNCAPG